jgi:hypothetical protein
MIHGQPTHSLLQFEVYLEKVIIRTFEKRSKNTSCEKAVLYILYRNSLSQLQNSNFFFAAQQEKILLCGVHLLYMRREAAL